MNILSHRRLSKAVLAATVGGIALMASAPAFAQATTTAAPQAATDETDTARDIVVVGTRRTDRSVTDSASPVDIIGAAEIAASPQVNLLDTVRNLVPSFFVPQNTISDASTLRRLSPNATFSPTSRWGKRA